MTGDPITGREPSLGGGSPLSGDEPFLGGEGSLAALLNGIADVDDVPSDVLVGRLAGVIPQLAPYLDGSDPRLRRTAARMIGLVAANHPATRSQTVPLLIRILDAALRKRDWPMVEMAVDRLGDTEDVRAALRVLKLVNTSAMYWIESRVQASLMRLGHLILPELMERALDDNAAIHRVVLASVGRTRQETHVMLREWLLPLATDPDQFANYHVNSLISTLSPTYLIEPLTAAAMDETQDIDRRQVLLRRLGYIHDHRVALLMLDILAGDDRRQRRIALFALISNRFREDIPRILTLIEHPDPQVRRFAIRIAGQRHIKASLPFVTGALAEPKAALRREAVRALRRIRDTSSVEPLVRMLKDRAAPVRYEAISALLAIAVRNPEQRVAVAAAYLDVIEHESNLKIRGTAADYYHWLEPRLRSSH